jgi:dipeptidyl aminopeptidase/acylaminoacyl peptidase
MPAPTTAPYGSWKSPITADLIVAGTVSLEQVVLDGKDIYWLEGRPSEAGRYVVVRYTPDGRTQDMTPAPFNARTRVHEYGGGSYTVADGVVYFTNFADQRVYRQRPGETPTPITPEGKTRYADFVMDRQRQSLVCVREDHSASEREAVNTIVRVKLAGNDVGTVLAGGNDFYSSPRLSPDGSRLAYLTWNHPNMPWDGTELWVAELDEAGAVKSSQRVAGGETESMFQPEWSPEGTLHVVSDRSGWWNLYRQSAGRIEALNPRAAEFGRPQWVFGMSTYAFISPHEIVCSYTERGVWHLARLDTVSGRLTPLALPFTDYGSIQVTPTHLVCVAGSPTEAAAVIRVDLASGRFERLRRSSSVALDPGYVSVPQAVEFPTERGQTAHAFYYPPANKDFQGQPGEKPPLLVISHGGPTGFSNSVLKLTIQYWTSRGFAVLDVNYGGSTGYGRAYRERLNDNWGIVDVDDCVNGARYLVERGAADRNRLAIRGGSAGGYTTLAVLTFRDYFRAGASHYGVSDLGALAAETHKFESRYLDRLIGPYPQRKDLYEQRSPVHAADRLSCPVILFQGLEDKVVLPNQAEMMVAALRAKGVPVAYVPFPGEQHGFRKAENIKRALEGELYFYGRIFGFPLAEPVEPVPIENLPR